MVAINNAIVREEHGTGSPGSHGIAIYFPEPTDYYDSIYETSTLFPQDTVWDELLKGLREGECGTMDVDPTSWDDTVTAGCSKSKDITVSASGGIVKGVTVSKIYGPIWLTLSQTNLGDVASGSSKTFTMTVSPPTGTSDDFLYTVRVNNTCGTPSSKDVTGSINVTIAKPVIVKVEPASQTVRAGDPLSVNVTVENVTDMGMDGAALNFDPSAMQAIAIIEGDFLKSAGATLPVTIIDNMAGTATFSYSLMTPGVGVSGNGTIATINFDTNASAESVFNLNLTKVLLANSTGGRINVAKIFNGTVNLSLPDITITPPGNNSIYSSTCVRLNFTVKPEGTVLDWIGYSLDGGANVTIAGNTTVLDALGVTPPCDHNIVVYANDTHGNMAASNVVYFTMHPGDINGDFTVYGFDLQRLAWAFLFKPGDPNWNERADLNCDNKIDGFDLQILAWNFLNDYTVIC